MGGARGGWLGLGVLVNDGLGDAGGAGLAGAEFCLGCFEPDLGAPS